MAEIVPFKGIIYNLKKIEDISLVTAPPYDIISEKNKSKYYERHPFNILRLELGDRDSNKDHYYSSYELLEKWLNNGILIRESEPAFYFYQIEFSLNGEELRKRKGFIGLYKLEEFGKGMIFPHEKIHKVQKEDRLNLLKICQANLSQIFSLYSDPDQIINSLFKEYTDTPPLFDYYDEDNIHHQLWSIKDKELFLRLRNLMKPKSIFIADGHHRYEAALEYKREMEKNYPNSTGSEPYYYTMMYFCPIEDEGLIILPSHRLIFNIQNFNKNEFESELKKYFIKIDIPFSPENENIKDFFENLKKYGENHNVFGLYINGNNHFSIFRFKNELNLSSIIGSEIPAVLQKLDVIILHRLIFEQLLGIKEEDQDQNHIRIIKNHYRAIELVREGKFQMVFFLNPPKVDEIKEVVSEGEIMPQKSTFFYPKLPTGLVINKLFFDEKLNEF